jgi:asparagine synthase (glutamine-hydrolysing)
MSGISAILRLRGDASADLGDLARMHAVQRHRGPDGEGAFAMDQGFRGRRLARPWAAPEGSLGPLRMVAAVSELKLTPPRAEPGQPFASPDGQVCVMLDGAIYNNRDLTTELGQAGREIRTGSDAEVVLEAYRHWGTGCFERFDGIWAILIVDLARRVVVGSRDRIGIKPLFCAVDGDRLLLASEAWPLAQAIGARIEPSRFFEFLSGFPPRSSKLSVFRGVHPIPAATWFEIDLSKPKELEPRPRAYWDLADFYPCPGLPVISFAEAADRFRSLLTSAIAAQSVAGGKAGSLLSGGLDTSTMVALWTEIASRRGSPKPQTFSIAWDDPQMSERPYIEAVAAKTGIDAKILTLTPHDVWHSVDDVIRAQAQPLLGQDLIAGFHVFRLARQQGASVVLGGDGSDETHAGLAYYEAQMVLERLAKFELVPLAKEIHGIAHANDRSYLQVVRSYIWGQLKRKRREDSHRLPDHAWLREEALDTDDPCWAESFAIELGRDRSLLNRVLYRETRHTNMPACLLFCDRNAMAHGVEARFPYLDHSLVEFLFSMPAPYKVGFGRRKKLLLETAEKYLPPAVSGRKDRKFIVLLSNWMPLRAHASALREAARLPAWSDIPYVDAPKLQRFVDGYLAGLHDDAYGAWRIFTASRWLDIFRPQLSP